MGYNGIYEYGQSMDDMFTDVKNRVINFEFFREYFDQVSLPVNLAEACVGDMFQPRPRRAAHKEFVKFIRLSTLRQHPRLPRFQDVQRELVDYREIEAFALQGALSLWGGDDVFSDSPCVFVSHRWQSPTHPDPDGAQTATILDRLNQVDEPEVYLWIDYCCLPQRGSRPSSRTDAEQLQIGLRRLPEIVKSCDLMILHSPDYLSRAWCYSELFVWLCKIAEVQFTDNDKKSKLFRSAHKTSGCQGTPERRAHVRRRGGEESEIPWLRRFPRRPATDVLPHPQLHTRHGRLSQLRRGRNTLRRRRRIPPGNDQLPLPLLAHAPAHGLHNQSRPRNLPARNDGRPEVLPPLSKRSRNYASNATSEQEEPGPREQRNVGFPGARPPEQK